MADPIRVDPHDALDPGPSTAGMVRHAAVTSETLWMGEVHAAAGARSDWHHHGERTTCGRVVPGKLEFEFGPNGTGRAVACAGDFCVVPPHVIHREGNPGAEEHEVVVTRVGSGLTVC